MFLFVTVVSRESRCIREMDGINIVRCVARSFSYGCLHVRRSGPYFQNLSCLSRIVMMITKTRIVLMVKNDQRHQHGQEY